MTKTRLVIATLAASLWIATAGTSSAQPPVATPGPQAGVKTAQNVPIEAQILISRYQGEKRVSSLPYVLSLKSSNISRGGALLRLGSRVPIRTQVYAPPTDGKPGATTNSVNYENVGTNIDIGATALDDGRFEVTVTINESSVVTDPQDLKATPGSDSYPVFRSYQSTNTLFVKDGQTTQFTAASDRVSGEVVRVEVKLSVLK